MSKSGQKLTTLINRRTLQYINTRPLQYINLHLPCRSATLFFWFHTISSILVWISGVFVRGCKIYLPFMPTLKDRPSLVLNLKLLKYMLGLVLSLKLFVEISNWNSKVHFQQCLPINSISLHESYYKVIIWIQY